MNIFEKLLKSEALGGGEELKIVFNKVLGIIGALKKGELASLIGTVEESLSLRCLSCLTGLHSSKGKVKLEMEEESILELT